DQEGVRAFIRRASGEEVATTLRGESTVDKWISVVTDPLGLAGFALFLVFSVLSLNRLTSDTSWMTSSFMAFAAVRWIRGLGLAYLRSAQSVVPTKETAAPPGAPISNSFSQPPGQIRQETSGAQSPAVSGVGGDVNINNQGTAPPQDAAASAATKRAT